MDVLIFDDTSEASLMTQYTGDKVYKRQAILTMNLAGGGGLELWQYLNKEPLSPLEKPMYGDIGIYAAKIKCQDVEAAHRFFSQLEHIQLSPIVFNPKNKT